MDHFLKGEIVAAIAKKLAHTIIEGDIKQATTAYFANNAINIPDKILKLGLAVSYGMGWQKRLTGKIYNNMSGHEFMISCCTGNIIGFKVKSESYSMYVQKSTTAS